MRDIRCVVTDHFGDVKCKAFWDGNDFYMTYTDIGNALGFEQPHDGVQKICVEHSKAFCGLQCVRDVSEWTSAGYAESLLNLEGIMEACMLSERPDADDFVDFVWRLVDKTESIFDVLKQDDEDDDDHCGCDANCCSLSGGYCDGNCPQPFNLDSLCDEYDDADDEASDELNDCHDTCIRDTIRDLGGIRDHVACADLQKAEVLIKMASSNRITYEQGRMLIDLALAECFGGRIPDDLMTQWALAGEKEVPVFDW